jgi:hypothetical protein
MWIKDGAASAAVEAAACRCTRMVRMDGTVTAAPVEPAPAPHGRGRVPADTIAANTAVAQMYVRQGDFVKIRRRGEGFWCQVRTCSGEELDVEVGNDLIHSPELPFGSLLRITRSDIEDLMTPEDCTAFGELLTNTFESAPAARPVEERWTAACIEAQVLWAQSWQPRVDRGPS